MLVTKPNKDHIYTCRLDHTIKPTSTDYKNVTMNLDKFESEPGFKICQIQVTDFEIITLPVENHEDDFELQKDNLFLKCRPNCNLERDSINYFLEEVKELLSNHQLWNPILQEDGTLLFKLEGDIFLKTMDSANYQLYEDDDHTSLKNYIQQSYHVKEHTETQVTLLLYRMCDLITNKFCWAACQVGINLF